MIRDYIENLNRIALVGPNSQGKTYALTQLANSSDIKNKLIAVWSEIKADDNMKNSADSTTLISWLNNFIDIEPFKNLMDEKLETFDFSSINDNNNIKVGLTNELKTYKGLVGAEITTTSNQFNKPGAGEKFLGTLYIISKILETYNNETYEYLIIDEPERHLHPSLYIKMATILKRLSEQGIKVIISTHSPIIVKYFVEDTNEIIKLDNGNCIQLPDKGQLFELYQDFNVYTEGNFKFSSYRRIENEKELYFEKFILPIIYDSLFSKYSVIAEGYAEKEVLDLVVEKFGTEDFLNNVNFVIVYGKCFIPWVSKCLQKISNKVIAIYDKDNLNEEKNVNLNENIENIADKTIPITDKIEELLGLQGIDDKVKKLTIEIRKQYIDNDANLMALLETIKNSVIELQDDDVADDE